MPRFNDTDKKWANFFGNLTDTVPLNTRHSKTVFYHGEKGRLKAKEFCQKNSAFNLDMLLEETPIGNQLYQRLIEVQKIAGFRAVEEAWWDLSRRLAEQATGDVRVFGDREFYDDVEHYRSKHSGSTHKFVDTVFEKVELPVLEANLKVNNIYYNGRLLANT